MAITLTGTGGLFTRLGRLFYGIKSANLYLGATDISAGGLKAAGVTYTDTLAQYASALQFVPDGLASDRDSVRSALGSWKTRLRSIAENTIIEQAHADVTLVSKDIDTALRELITQMVGAGSLVTGDNDVDASTVSATVSGNTGNTGNGQLRCSVVRPDGRQNELVLAETLEAICTSDGQQGGTARQETFSLKGEVAVSDKLGWDWPGGSGASTSLTAIDADQNASGNLLYNSNFDAYTTANQPDYWGAPLVGTVGTDILSEASVVYRTSGKALRFLGTGGAPLSSLAQQFAVASPAVASSGTSSTLKPDTVYAVNWWMRKTAGLVAGVVEVGLVDGSNAAVNDDAGTANTVSTAFGSMTTSFAAYGGFFRTPKVLPSTLKLRVRVSTALTSGESVYIDDLAVCEATRVYDGGPYAAKFAGSTNFILNDKVTVAVANNYAGDFQTYFERLFDMRAKGLQLPSDTAAGETIVDTLIA